MSSFLCEVCSVCGSSSTSYCNCRRDQYARDSAKSRYVLNKDHYKGTRINSPYEQRSPFDSFEEISYQNRELYRPTFEEFFGPNGEASKRNREKGRRI